MDHERRIARLEGISEEISATLRSIDTRLNSLEHRITYLWATTVLLWATTIGTVVGGLFFFRG